MKLASYPTIRFNHSKIYTKYTVNSTILSITLYCIGNVCQMDNDNIVQMNVMVFCIFQSAISYWIE